MQLWLPAEAEQARGSALPAAAAPSAAPEAAATEGGSMATIHDLPDGLLGAVLARLGRDRWAGTLVAVHSHRHGAVLLSP